MSATIILNLRSRLDIEVDPNYLELGIDQPTEGMNNDIIGPTNLGFDNTFVSKGNCGGLKNS